MLQEKAFGGGFKGLRAEIVSNANQYSPVLLAWIKPTAAPIYAFVADTVYRSELRK
jgi:hypothetical protein